MHMPIVTQKTGAEPLQQPQQAQQSQHSQVKEQQ